jgi:hypothetical protein
MVDGNSFDFTYSFYRQLLLTAKINFEHSSFSQAPEIFTKQNSKPIIFLRHDVDLDISKALAMAKIENENDVKSCFMVMTNCPFYSIKNSSTKTFLKELIGMNHEIGLHFDFSNPDERDENALIDDKIIAQINSDCARLENIISQRINSISFHRPLKQFLRGPLIIADRINAYSADLMDWYLSDSKGMWREGNPTNHLINPKKNILQLLVHPIWWNDMNQNAQDRLQSFFEEKTKNFSEAEKIIFDKNLSSHLSIYRSKKED